MTDETANPVGRPTKYRPEYCEMVQADMEAGYSLTAFAGLIDVDRTTIGEWMSVYPEFSLAVSRAKAKRLRSWETKGINAAAKGGGPGASTMIIFGLKNMGGDEWTEKQAVSVSIAADAPVLSPDEPLPETPIL